MKLADGVSSVNLVQENSTLETLISCFAENAARARVSRMGPERNSHSFHSDAIKRDASDIEKMNVQGRASGILTTTPCRWWTSPDGLIHAANATTVVHFDMRSAADAPVATNIPSTFPLPS
jgi:hypothetical protein